MGNTNILVVDDDPDTCHLVSFMLEREDYQVEVAYSAVEGIEKFQSSTTDLVVLDIMMPDVDGWETCRRMKATKDIPVLFLSALSDIKSIARGFDDGGDDYVCKPFRTGDLTSRVRNLLQNGSRSAHDIPLKATEITVPLEECTQKSRSLRYYPAIKRLMDILISGLSLILLVPLMLLIALLIKIDSPGPVIFKQQRIRRKERTSDDETFAEFETFTFFKFRTMYQGSSPDAHRDYTKAFIENDQERMVEIQTNDNQTRKLTTDTRITRLGKFLRKSSIDEIPQLWNVLKGDMSIVGPRPPIAYEVEFYDAWHRRRLLAKPGLTGLWQAMARSSADFDEMVRMDIWYFEHQSLMLDLKILMKTPFSILSMDGAV